MDAVSPLEKSVPEPGSEPRPSANPANLVTELYRQADSTLKLLTAFGAVVTLLAGGVKVIVQDDRLAILIAGAGVLSMAFVGARAYRARTSRPVADAPQRILRGLLPFQGSAQLPERHEEVELLSETVSSSAFRFGVLFGKFGSGKTSLVRAGLLPRLEATGPAPVYVASIGHEPLAATAQALRRALARGTSRDLHDHGGTSPRDLLRTLEGERKQSVVLIYDQFEDFFALGGARDGPRRKFMRWVGDCIEDAELHVGFLFVVRDDAQRQMGDFAPFVPEARSAAHRHELRDLRPDQARNVLRLAVERREAAFEPDLIDAIVQGLTGEDAVRPALLQIVATRLREQGVATVEGYRELGQAIGILEAYVFEKVHDAVDAPTACAILKLLASGDGSQPVAAHDVERLERAVRDAAGPGGESRDRHVAEVLQELTSARLVLAKGDGTYRLAHRYLRTPVKGAIAERAPAVQEADELLDRYAALYAAGGCTRVPRRELRRIRRHATPALQRSEPARGLLKRSEAAIRQALVKRVAAGLAVALVALAFATGVVAPRRDWEPVAEFTLFDPTLGSETLPMAVAFHPQGSWLESNLLVMASSGPSGGLFSLKVRSGVLSFTNRLFGTAPTAVPGTTGTTYASLALSPSGSTLVSGGPDGTIRVWKTETWENQLLNDRAPVPEAATCENKAVVFLGFNRVGDRLVSASECGLLQVWDMTQATPLASMRVPFSLGAHFVRLSPDGTHVAALRPREGLEDESAIYVWKFADGIFRDAYPGPIMPDSAVLLGLGFDHKNALVVATHDQNRFELRIYDRAGAGAFTVDPVTGADVDDDSRTVISLDARVVGVTDLHDALRIWERDVPRAASLATTATTVAILSPDGQALVLSKFPSSHVYTNELRLFRVPTRGQG